MQTFEEFKNSKLKFENPSQYYKITKKLNHIYYNAKSKQEENKDVLIKKIDANSLNEQSIKQFKLEFIALNKVNSPFQVNFIDAFFHKENYYIVIDAMEG